MVTTRLGRVATHRDVPSTMLQSAYDLDQWTVAVEPDTCLVCHGPAVRGQLCSAACAGEAARERDDMVARTRTRDVDPHAGDAVRARIAELTAAVLGWRPAAPPR